MDWSSAWKSLENGLPWIAAFAGLIAAIGGFWAAVATSMGASAAFGQLDLQRKPVIVLTCTSTFRLQEEAHKIAPPVDVLFLQPGQEGSGLVPFDNTIPTYTQDGKIIEYPPLYARCMLTNAGALPVVQVELPLTVTFWNDALPPTPGQTEQRVIRLPFLKAGESYEFGIAQGSSARASFKFDRTATLTRIDTERPTPVTVFVNQGFMAAENQIMNGFERRPGSAPKDQ
jgi:hypothetical protein